MTHLARVTLISVTVAATMAASLTHLARGAEPKREPAAADARLTGSLLPHRPVPRSRDQKKASVAKTRKSKNKGKAEPSGPVQRGRFTTDEILKDPAAYIAR